MIDAASFSAKPQTCAGSLSSGGALPYAELVNQCRVGNKVIIPKELDDYARATRHEQIVDQELEEPECEPQLRSAWL